MVEGSRDRTGRDHPVISAILGFSPDGLKPNRKVLYPPKRKKISYSERQVISWTTSETGRAPLFSRASSISPYGQYTSRTVYQHRSNRSNRSKTSRTSSS